MKERRSERKREGATEEMEERSGVRCVGSLAGGAIKRSPSPARVGRGGASLNTCLLKEIGRAHV